MYGNHLRNAFYSDTTKKEEAFGAASVFIYVTSKLLFVSLKKLIVCVRCFC